MVIEFSVLIIKINLKKNTVQMRDLFMWGGIFVRILLHFIQRLHV